MWSNFVTSKYSHFLNHYEFVIQDWTLKAIHHNFPFTNPKVDLAAVLREFIQNLCFSSSGKNVARLPRLALAKTHLTEKLRVLDGIPEGFQIVYRAPMSNYVLALSMGSAITVSLLSAIGIYVLSNSLTLDDLTQATTFGTRTVVSTNKYELVIFMLSFIGFNAAIGMMIHRYPLRIFRKADEYIAIFEGHIPFRRRRLAFQKGQVEPIPPTGVLPWRENRFSINGSRSILFEQYFRTPSELHRMINDKYHYYQK